MPGAGRNPWPASDKKSWRQSPQVQPNIRHSLRDGFTDYTRSPQGPAVLPLSSTRCARHHRQLDLSTGRPGPHDFSVRLGRARRARLPRPPPPRPTHRDDWPNVPLHRGGMCESIRVICPTRQAARLRQTGTTGYLRTRGMRGCASKLRGDQSVDHDFSKRDFRAEQSLRIRSYLLPDYIRRSSNRCGLRSKLSETLSSEQVWGPQSQVFPGLRLDRKCFDPAHLHDCTQEAQHSSRAR
jgi:hypothetical protein